DARPIVGDPVNQLMPTRAKVLWCHRAPEYRIVAVAVFRARVRSRGTTDRARPNAHEGRACASLRDEVGAEAHLVPGPLTPVDVQGVGVVPVAFQVVLVAGVELLRLDEAVRPLPVEVPVRDIEHALLGATLPQYLRDALGTPRVHVEGRGVDGEGLVVR